jgi:hypothetical protein
MVIIIFSISAQDIPSPAGGGWIEFNGKDSFAFAKSVIVNKEHTIEVWIKPEKVPEKDDKWIIAGKPGKYELSLVGGEHPFFPNRGDVKFAILFSIMAAGGITRTNILDENQLSQFGQFFNKWHHIAITNDGNQMILYFDGKGIGLDPNPLPISDDSSDILYVGGVANQESTTFDGAMDEICFLDEDRPPKLERIEPDDKTTALWHFDENVKSKSFKDASVNNNTLFSQGVEHTVFFDVKPLNKLTTAWGNLKTIK